MKIVCIYHNQDLDGWMSAAIVKHWFNQQEVPTNKPGVFNTLDFLGYNYGQPIPDLSEYDKVIMCDVSFPRIEMHKLASEKDFTWIDHHISAITENIAFDKQCYEEKYKGIRGINFAACELTWRYFFHSKPMPEIVRLLGLYDSFRHKTKSFKMSNDGYNDARQYLEEVDKLKEFENNKTSTDGYSLIQYANDVAKRLSEEQKALEFQYGARNVICNYQDAYEYLLKDLKNNLARIDVYNAGRIIYGYLCTEAKQIYKSRFRIVFEEYREDLKLNPFNPEQGSTMQYKFICINKERFNPINFGIDYHKDGYDGCACFWYNGSAWCFSLYNDNGKVDCSKLAAQFEGGGHAGAAGFRIKDIDKFFKEHKINKNEPLA